VATSRTPAAAHAHVPRGRVAEGSPAAAGHGGVPVEVWRSSTRADPCPTTCEHTPAVPALQWCRQPVLRPSLSSALSAAVTAGRTPPRTVVLAAMAWRARVRAAAAQLLGPDAEHAGPFVRRALQFGGMCYCADQFGFHLSMVSGRVNFRALLRGQLEQGPARAHKSPRTWFAARGHRHRGHFS
jgi:hypothetical protein